MQITLLIFHLNLNYPILSFAAETNISFRYYKGISGNLAATSPSVLVHNNSAKVSCYVVTYISWFVGTNIRQHPK